jgi:electron transport complex protein RnfB
VTVAIDDRCTACGLCLMTCPTTALVAAPRRPAVRDEACTDCWLCLEICPVDAITAAGTDGGRRR